MTRKIELENGYILYSDHDTEENVLVIDEEQVQEKRKGTGTELVEKVQDIAREEGKDIEICANPLDDSISLRDLMSFYEKLGFSVVDYDDTFATMRW